MPGGRQKHGETLEQALMRECLEEIGTQIKIGQLLFVRECIGRNHIDNCVPEDDWFKNLHGIDFIFACQIPNEYTAQNGISPDRGQEQVEWLPVANLDKYRLFPSPLKQLLMNQISSEVYLGDVH
ncbi:MAG: NUDIX domain-containing protein [Heteroscytonema crispum UTEX LB 1556]